MTAKEKRVALAFAAVVAAPFVVAILMRISAAREVSRLLDEARASGGPTTADELDREPTGDDASGPLREAFELMKRPSDDLDFAMSETEVGRPLFEPQDKEISDAALSAFLDSNRAAFAKLEEAARRPRCAFGWRHEDGLFVKLPELMPLKNAVECLHGRAFALARLGRGDEALATVATMLALSRDADEGANIICYLVRMAMESLAVTAIEATLSSSEPSERACLELESKLRSHRKGDELVRAFEGERVLGFTSMDDLGRMFDEEKAPRPWVLRVPLLSRWAVSKNEASYLSMMNRGIEKLRAPTPATFDELDALGREVGELSPLHLATKLECPAFGKILEKHFRGEARRSAARVALALRVHRLRSREYPAALGALAPSILRELPLDPFTGGALRYRRSERGFAVWSVGRDGKDDGGPPHGPELPTRVPDDDGVVVER